MRHMTSNRNLATCLLAIIVASLLIVASAAANPEEIKKKKKKGSGLGINISIDVTKIISNSKKKPATAAPAAKKKAPAAAPAAKKKAPAAASASKKKPPVAAAKQKQAKPAVKSNKSTAAPARSAHAPAPGETRFRRAEVLFILKPDAGPEALAAIVQSQNLNRIAEADIALLERRLYRYAITDGRSVAQVVTALEGDLRIEIAQPNYVYELTEEALAASAPVQYANALISLPDAHALSLGRNIRIAVIDSRIDDRHPALEGRIAETLVSVDAPSDAAHKHGTAMAGAIAGRGLLTGTAPAAILLAIEAFAPDETGKITGVSFHVLKAVDWAQSKNAQIQNLSFAGPVDPLLGEVIAKASAKGTLFVAAAGNSGAKSPPLYPAADENVIGVTAVDSRRKIYSRANRGDYIMVAAPGVDILSLAPGGATNLSTGTSIATAHVSGLLALAMEKAGAFNHIQARQLLSATADRLKAPAKSAGFGLVNAKRMIETAGLAKN